MRFTTAQAGDEWSAQTTLAEACEHAALTRHQAEAARLAADGKSFRAIASHLDLPYPAARSVTLAASRRLRRAHPHLVQLDREFLWDMYACIRNVRGPAPKNAVVYAPRPGGGYERRPVSLRPRPAGEVPEDLQLCPIRFLRELPRLLAQWAVRSE